ncbi:hypothetical protein EWM62_07530 [Mucilaginibacter terrigena]|uniref:Uncharacterized protein n=1 Tax=Mucilaginibacter terrigena TaxID=2492395 RepID=A0A4Q5LL94_9SPHI|nr:hypothetical protein [Mucilaginibacter terrigena]RYU90501.1 hypothetical protein EWM62_07530 [Mucilaginibacter terrigena]
MKRFVFIGICFALLVTVCIGLAYKKDSPVTDIDTTPDSAAKAVDKRWVFDKVKGAVLLFKGGKQFDTKIYEVKYIGQITNGGKAPFLLFTGRGCDECDANIALYIQSPDDPYHSDEYEAERYDLPGKEKDYETDSLIYKGRAFYGQIFKGVKGVVWYQQNLMQDNSWQKSTYFVSLKSGLKKDTMIKAWNKMPETLKLLQQGACKEIAGSDYYSEP